jgi:hypothetical protein
VQARKSKQRHWLRKFKMCATIMCVPGGRGPNKEKTVHCTHMLHREVSSLVLATHNTVSKPHANASWVYMQSPMNALRYEDSDCTVCLSRRQWLLLDYHILSTYTSQSMPSDMPLPSIAEQATILQFRSLSSPSLSASDISPAPCAPGWSCLFANTRSAASRSSSSLSIERSSSAAISRRSMSVESMTKITAAVLA